MKFYIWEKIFLVLLVITMLSISGLSYIGILSSKIYSIKYHDDFFVNLVIDKCEEKETNLSKVNCVNEFMAQHFKYGEKRNLIGDSPSHMFSNTGNCKESSFFYELVLNKLGIETKLVFLNNHVYTIAYSDNFYCNLDQEYMNCATIEVKEK